ncbi:hypothetical protein ACFWUQ_07135 [Streptomyces sp. NPDC058662]|uniref:hypothetical protein n=1 Tax=Streptomyces sp. NPDC058662 TaxID=3346583 RepID=UPI0036489523
MADSGGEVPDFRPTHVVPGEGLAAWETADVSRPTTPLDAFLPVQLLARRGEWGEILCANGWSAWVDGRLLVPVPLPPPTTGGPAPARTEDPRPLLARSADAVGRYRRAVEEHAAGRLDAEGFRNSVRGLRAGIVLDGESAWLYDRTADRWLYAEGPRAATFAVAGGPGERPATTAPVPEPSEADTVGVQLDVLPEPGEAHEPTRIVQIPEAPRATEGGER